jgi:hypothetical protein
MEKFLNLDADTLSILLSSFQFGDIVNFAHACSLARKLTQGYIFPLVVPALWEVNDRNNESSNLFDDPFFDEDEKLSDAVTPNANFGLETLKAYRRSICCIVRDKLLDMDKEVLQRHICAFLFVCKYGHLDLVEKFIGTLKSEIFALYSLNDILISVIESNRRDDLSVICFLMELVESVDEMNIYTNCFSCALEKGNIALVDFILNEKFHVVDKSSISVKEFRNACLVNEDRIGLLVDILAKLKDTISAKVLDEFYSEGLKICAQRGKLETFRFLIDFVDISADDYGCVVWMTTYGNVDVFKIYAAKGGKLNARNDYAFRWAGRTGNLALVRYLAQHPEVDVYSEDSYAQHWAKRNGYHEVANYIVSLMNVKFFEK